jgi:hypothetical protein
LDARDKDVEEKEILILSVKKEKEVMASNMNQLEENLKKNEGL